METFVIRKFFKETYTIGRFLVEDRVICNTLEDKVRELYDINHDGDYDDSEEGKLYGETAIPCGRYKLTVSYSPKLKRRLPLINDVPGFTGIRIHKLVSAKGTEGCVGVGENTSKGKLSNGRYYETLIIQLIDEAIQKGEECWITIKQ